MAGWSNAAANAHSDNRGFNAGETLSSAAGRSDGLVFCAKVNGAFIQPPLWSASHRPCGTGEVSAGYLYGVPSE